MRHQLYILMALLAPAALSGLAMARASTGEQVAPDLSAVVQRIVLELSEADPAVRERASLVLKNLPLEAYPALDRLVADHQDFDPETAARLEGIRTTLKSLSRNADRIRQLKQWDVQHALEAYEKFGSKDARWDEAVRQVIPLMVETTWTRQAPGPKAKAALQSAKTAGCTDPLFLYWYANYSLLSHELDEHAVALLLRDAAKSIRGSAYPPEHQCSVMAAYATTVGRAPGAWPDVPAGDHRDFATAALGEFRKLRQNKEIPGRILFDLAEGVANALSVSGMNRWETVALEFEAVRPDSVYAVLFAGKSHMLMSRQDYWANGGPDLKTPADHCQKAEACFEKAYQMDKTDPIIADNMLQLAATAAAEPGVIDKWFRRAMEANPDDYSACRMKLKGLYDMPDGGEEAALGFARECVSTQNWRGRLPFLLVDAHELISGKQQEREEYLSRPDVWGDIQSVYEIYLKLYPYDLFVRSRYARAATICTHWAEADRQFRILGDHPEVAVFGSMSSYDYLRKKAARLANAAQTQPAITPPIGK